ncbi:MAG: class I SAM-dependent rRNA methyltransferase [Balneolales bacterium]|nr:class I SAM-dependent rRNA methyltransferase [Balneolales bacterium]
MTDPVTVKLRAGADKRLRRGHLWVFSNEIASVEPGTVPHADDASELTEKDLRSAIAPGSVARLIDQRGQYIGTGYYHPHSLIAFRLVTSREVDLGQDFYTVRISEAAALRRQLRPGAQAMRVVHGESDGLPGLLIDQIGAVVSIQVVSAGAENHLDFIVNACKEVLQPGWIILRNDAGLRKLEGLPEYVKIVHGSDEVPVQTITEHGITYEVDILEGQKTGFYVDQHENRLQFRRFVKSGDRVLDAFCNDGGFALHAASAGAQSVTALDISQPALDRAVINARNNGLADQIRFERADLMKWLPQQAAVEPTSYDVVNLDPPSFAKNRKTAAAALKGYQKLHEAALRLLKPGGFMATATCSHHIDTQRFIETVTEAARRTGMRVTMVWRGSQPVDHPVLPAMPETEYLRFFVFQVKS